jgi:hypothetical protein
VRPLLYRGECAINRRNIHLCCNCTECSASRPIITFTLIIITYLYSHDGSCGSVLGPEIDRILVIVTKTGLQSNFQVTVQSNVTSRHSHVDSATIAMTQHAQVVKV